MHHENNINRILTKTIFLSFRTLTVIKSFSSHNLTATHVHDHREKYTTLKATCPPSGENDKQNHDNAKFPFIPLPQFGIYKKKKNTDNAPTLI